MGARWVRLELDLATFDAHAVAVPTLPSGVTITDLAALGDTPANRRRVYELNRTCSADIPDDGPFFTYEEYDERRFASVMFRPDGNVLALDGDSLIGMCALSRKPDQPWAFIEMTGVLAPYRRQGISTAMKVRALAAARQWGVTHVRTLHKAGNAPIIAANRHLGFVDSDYDLASLLTGT